MRLDTAAAVGLQLSALWFVLLHEELSHSKGSKEKGTGQRCIIQETRDAPAEQRGQGDVFVLPCWA